MNGNRTHRLVVASRNHKKAREMAELLAPYGIEVVSVTDCGDVPEVIEDQDSFAGNAAKKASQTAAHLGEWTIADDSGLCVDYLEGAPGVYSARFSGEDATDERNNAKLLKELAGVPDEKRGAHYVCHIAVADPSGTVRIAEEARCSGRIVDVPRGANGFGYDPYFLIPEYHRTFGELSTLVKHQISHRAKAFARTMPKLVALLTGGP